MSDHNLIQRFAALQLLVSGALNMITKVFAAQQLFITDKTNGKFAIILSNKPKITQQGIYYQILLNKTTPTE
jgi:hypothetical protein